MISRFNEQVETLLVPTAPTDAQQCTLCARLIPREVPRLDVAYRGFQGYVARVYICGACLVRLGTRAAQSSAVQDWLSSIMAEEL